MAASGRSGVRWPKRGCSPEASVSRLQSDPGPVRASPGGAAETASGPQDGVAACALTGSAGAQSRGRPRVNHERELRLPPEPERLCRGRPHASRPREDYGAHPVPECGCSATSSPRARIDSRMCSAVSSARVLSSDGPIRVGRDPSRVQTRRAAGPHPSSSLAPARPTPRPATPRPGGAQPTLPQSAQVGRERDTRDAHTALAATDRGEPAPLDELVDAVGADVELGGDLRNSEVGVLHGMSLAHLSALST